MTKLVIGLAAFVLLAAGGAFAGGALAGSSNDAGFATTTTTNGTTTLGSTVEDTTTGQTTTAEIGVSGPCDEAEHANDPRCTGTAPAVAGRGNDDHGDDDHGDDEDRSGLNRGHGGGSDDENDD
jgi:hypothetical protein